MGGNGGQAPSFASLCESCAAVPPLLTFGQNMKLATTAIIVRVMALVVSAALPACRRSADTANESEIGRHIQCPICEGELVDVTQQKDDQSKPSRNLAVWNRSVCANPFFHEGSLICLRDGYAYEFQLEHWELSLEDRDGFAHPLDKAIYEFPLPIAERIKSRVVYSQRFVDLGEVEHEFGLWTSNDDDYFDKISNYSDENGIDLSIEPYPDRGEVYFTAKQTTKTEQGVGGQPATPPRVGD